MEKNNGLLPQSMPRRRRSQPPPQPTTPDAVQNSDGTEETIPSLGEMAKEWGKAFMNTKRLQNMPDSWLSRRYLDPKDRPSSRTRKTRSII